MVIIRSLKWKSRCDVRIAAHEMASRAWDNGMMRTLSKRLVVVGLLLGWTPIAWATPDDVVEKYLTAIGGREALGKLKSRSMIGTITLSTPGGDVSGSVEILNQAPNKTRTLMKVDLSAFGAGVMTLDQRFDGKSGYVLDTLQGDRDVTGNQLENMKNGAFPSPFLNYKEVGATLELSGKEKVGEREAYLLIFKPRSGSVARQYIDAESYLPIKLVVKVDVPQFGELEQTTEFLDYRDVDGVKVPFQVKATSAVQQYTIVITKVEHNVQIDEALFSKPAAGR